MALFFPMLFLSGAAMPRQELFNAIEKVARGESVLAPTVAARLMQRMRSPAEEPLSSREIEALQLVARGNSNREIGKALHISTATVKTNLVRSSTSWT